MPVRLMKCCVMDRLGRLIPPLRDVIKGCGCCGKYAFLWGKHTTNGKVRQGGMCLCRVVNQKETP